MTNYWTKNSILDYNCIGMRNSSIDLKTILMNLALFSVYFPSIDERESEEGFNSTNLVPRQVDAFCGLWV